MLDTLTLPEAPPVVIADVTYVPVSGDEMTFAHEEYMMTHCQAAGLGGIGQLIAPGVDVEEMSAAIIGNVAASGRMTQVLAGAYVPDGVEWSPEVAQETARVFAGSRDRAANRALWGAVASVAIGFIVRAAESRGISLSSLGGLSEADARDGTGEAATSETSQT
jgi:hypothetical protein